MPKRYDVVVVGSGNAGFCAAHAAREHAARVLIVEKAPRAWAGGNSYFTAGATRTTFASLDDLRPILDDLTDGQAAEVELPPYSPAQFMADMIRVTDGRCDRALAAILVNDAAAVVRWMYAKGIRWKLMYERQSFRVDGKSRFFGNLPLGTVGEGKGLIAQHTAAALASGIEIRYDSPVSGLLRGAQGAVTGVVVDGPEGRAEIAAGAVVLASGGFEADPQRRAMYLGPNWDVAKVRGTPYNTGEVLQLALDAGAQPYGHWSGCHAIQWDAGAPPTGDREIAHRFSKQSYPIGIVVNRDARRFLDEGADFRNYTYAKYGAEILKQPGAIAWQLFDAKTAPLLRQDEYTAPGVSRHEAATIRALATSLGLNADALEETVAAFNAAIQPGEFNPAIKDGVRTVGITPPKSNWALPLDTPPYLAFAITCGITFTFGGVKIDAEARVLDRADRPIPGLHAAGELVGGLFSTNYPGGSGLTSGAVFGRRAGATAGKYRGLRTED
ncbi:MAG: FAD-dependent tricarballylate dehydrogenase TcuA [Thermomicrobia bacterium]|nr:FAD-dependent tricarballylate dehydrogenase TcuA [Thermomicrobia bacterium]